MMKKTNLLLMFLLICQFVFAATQDSIVAIVNKTPITRVQLDKLVSEIRKTLPAGQKPSEQQLQHDVLELLIDKTLQLEVAKQHHITVSSAEVQAQVASVLGTQATAEQKQQIRDGLLLQKLQQVQVIAHINISDEELDNMVTKLKEHDTQLTQYKLRHVLIPINAASSVQEARKLALNIAKKLERAHAALPKQIDTFTIQDELWDYRTQDQIPHLFIKSIKLLTKNQVSSIIKAPNGYHILKLLDTKQASLSTTIKRYHLKEIVRRIDSPAVSNLVKENLLSIRKRLLRGESFAKLARMYSQRPKSASQSGDAGWLSQQALPTHLADAVAKLKIGQLSQPIAVGAAWFLVKKIDEQQKSDNNQAYQQRARQHLLQQKFAESMQRWLQQLRAQAYIQRFDSNVSTSVGQ